MGEPCGGATILAIFYGALHPTALLETAPDSEGTRLIVIYVLCLSDGNIQMRYIPPDLRRDDDFHLVAAANPFDDPEEIVACTRKVPKIYIFSCK